MPFKLADWPLACLSSCAQNPIDLHSRTPQGSGNRGWTQACRVHRLDLLPVEPPLATSIHAISLRALNPLALPPRNKPALHLSNHPEHGHDDPPSLAAGGDVGVEHCDESLSLIAVV